MHREAFIDQVRARVNPNGPANLPHPLPPAGPIPAVRYAANLANPVEAFIANATAVGATCTRTTRSSLNRFVEDVAVQTGARSVVLSRDPEVQEVAPWCLELGLVVVPWDRHSAARADLGITGAVCGIAATGSLVLDSGRAGGRTAGLFPAAHLAVVRAESILPTASELFRELPRRLPHGLPSQLVLATGPSRSADIEMQITVGVHGPGRVWIAVVEDVTDADRPDDPRDPLVEREVDERRDTGITT